MALGVTAAMTAARVAVADAWAAFAVEDRARRAMWRWRRRNTVYASDGRRLMREILAEEQDSQDAQIPEEDEDEFIARGIERRLDADELAEFGPPVQQPPLPAAAAAAAVAAAAEPDSEETEVMAPSSAEAEASSGEDEELLRRCPPPFSVADATPTAAQAMDTPPSSANSIEASDEGLVFTREDAAELTVHAGAAAPAERIIAAHFSVQRGIFDVGATAAVSAADRRPLYSEPWARLRQMRLLTSEAAHALSSPRYLMRRLGLLRNDRVWFDARAVELAHQTATFGAAHQAYKDLLGGWRDEWAAAAACASAVASTHIVTPFGSETPAWLWADPHWLARTADSQLYTVVLDTPLVAPPPHNEFAARLRSGEERARSLALRAHLNMLALRDTTTLSGASVPLVGVAQFADIFEFFDVTQMHDVAAAKPAADEFDWSNGARPVQAYRVYRIYYSAAMGEWLEAALDRWGALTKGAAAAMDDPGRLFRFRGVPRSLMRILTRERRSIRDTGSMSGRSGAARSLALVSYLEDGAVAPWASVESRLIVAVGTLAGGHLWSTTGAHGARNLPPAAAAAAAVPDWMRQRIERSSWRAQVERHGGGANTTPDIDAAGGRTNQRVSRRGRAFT